MLTPEELEALQQLSGINPHFNPLPQHAPVQAAPAPVQQPDLAEPYNRQAQSYQQQATELESQKAAQYPEAHGAKEHLVEAARAAMESFGRYGAPGGYEGQEAQRQKNFQTQQNVETNNRLDRAKQLRSSAQQQQELGQTVAQRGETNKYNEGNLAETRKLREIQEREATSKEAAAHKPIVTTTSPGSTTVARDPDTGLPISGSETSVPATKPQRAYHFTKLNIGGRTEEWAVDSDTGEPVRKVGDAPQDSSADDMQIVQGKVGADGSPQYIRVPKNGPAGAITINGDAIAPKDPEAPQQLKNQGDSAFTTTKMATIVRNLVTAKPQLVGPVGGRLNELMLKFGGDPAGIVAAANSMQPGDEKDTALLAGHMAYLFLNEARATMPGRPASQYMDFVKQRSAQMTQNPQLIEGYLQSAENNARIIMELSEKAGYAPWKKMVEPTAGGSDGTWKVIH